MPSQKARGRDGQDPLGGASEIPGRRLRRILIATLTLLGLGSFGCAAAIARTPPAVRVLLYDGSEPIRVGTIDAPRRVVLGAGGRLQIEGLEQSREWRPKGAGPWQVGPRRVRGQIAVRTKNGRIQVLNRIGLEDYVASTVGGEMSPSWPEEALRAQAVATRTYVLHEARKRQSASWDVRATAASQVYKGIEAETDATRSATRATRGEVLTYGGKPILAVFHSTAGGRTATAGEVWGKDLPYLRVVDVEDEDDAPHTYWRAAYERQALGDVFRASGHDVGRLESVAVTRRTASGRVQRLAVRGERRSVELTGSRLRGILGPLGLRSTLFEVRDLPEGVTFVGSGHGHGVGMSQWGARAMARQGAEYPRILARFYPGTRLERWRSDRLASRSTGRTGSAGGTE